MTATLLTPTLLAATVATGLTAGFLAAFAHTVMPALATTDDATYVSTFQAVDRAVANPWFMVPFTLAPLVVGGALLLALGDGQRAVALNLGAALVLTVATIVVTGVVHLPLNRELADVTPGSPLLGEARLRFEQGWVPWHVVRTLTSTAAFVSLALALLRVR